MKVPNIVKRPLGATNTVLAEVDKTKAIYIENGVRVAYFDVNGTRYRYVENGLLEKQNKVSLTWRKLSNVACKNGIYHNYNVGGVPIKSYILAMTCFVEGFYQKYMDDKNLVVNHTVVQLVDTYWGIRAEPVYSVESNVQYLEVIPQYLNIRHGAFVNKWGLFNVYVSAYDIDELEKLFMNVCTENPDDYRHAVVMYYKKHKPNFKVEF